MLESEEEEALIAPALSRSGALPLPLPPSAAASLPCLLLETSRAAPPSALKQLPLLLVRAPLSPAARRRSTSRRVSEGAGELVEGQNPLARGEESC
jgi:hypothetical protein